MNKFIKYDSEKCDDCYKCLRTCPTKAIMINKDQRKIIEELCIKCGACKRICPRDAIEIQNDKYLIKKWLNQNKTIAVSLAPSFAGIKQFNHYHQLIAGLKRLGFKYIEETSVGAEAVAKIYEDELKNHSKGNIITTACPASNFYIEKNHPELIKQMLPIVSPMIYHGRLLKKQYDSDIKVVFIGPCLAKKAEAFEMKGAVDGVLTFNELIEWFAEEDIILDKLAPQAFDAVGSKRGAAFPLGSTLFKKDLNNHLNDQLNFLRVTGIDACKDVLNSLEEDQLNNYCVEINICDGSCINGPDFPSEKQHFYESRDLIKNYVEQQGIEHKETKVIEYKRTFKNKKKYFEQPSEEELQEILRSIGKYDEHDELNCGACGYTTCRQKAISIYYEMSDPHMCMAYLREKAESFQSVFFEHSPNALCILDEDFTIVDYNNAFHNIFGYSNINLEHFPISAFFDEELFETFFNSDQTIYKEKIFLSQYDKKFYLTLVYVEAIEAIVLILMDITLEENYKKEVEMMKKDTLDTCQNVIEEQMRVAQEIASLLGETTAQTKVNLNKLKSLVLNDKDRSI